MTDEKRLNIQNIPSIILFTFATLLLFKIIHIENVNETHIILMYIMSFLYNDEVPVENNAKFTETQKKEMS